MVLIEPSPDGPVPLSAPIMCSRAVEEDDPEAENAKMTPKERELTRQVTLYKAALSCLEVIECTNLVDGRFEGTGG